MKFANQTHLDTRSIRRLVAAIGRDMLDPVDYKEFRCEVIYKRRKTGWSYVYWPNGKRIQLRVTKDYTPKIDELVLLVSGAIKGSFKTRAAFLSASFSLGPHFTLGVKAAKAEKEIPETFAEQQKQATRLKGVSREIKALASRMKRRATRMKRAETQQKNDQRRLNYLRKRLVDVNAAHDLASAEAELERQAAEEREAEKFSKPKSQTQGWVDTIKKMGEESR